MNQLLFVGLNAAYRVNATTMRALNRGYKVILFSEGIATESGRGLDELAQKRHKAGGQVKEGTEM